ncbi:transducin family protein / WD-40 repeat family protein isoform X2 [Wolffia australiana]
MGAVDLDLHVLVHHGIPYTASTMALDPVQCLLAIGTLDGRIKIIGGDNIEALLISPQKLPYKFLEFLHNQGFIIGVSNGNEIQVWDLENRCLTCSLQWESNITAFCVIQGTYFMYLGDENGSLSVLKLDAEKGTLLTLPYQLTISSAKEAAGVPFSGNISIVGILQQPSTSGDRVLIAYEDGVMILWDISENCVVVVHGHTDFLLKGEELSSIQSTSDSAMVTKEICSLCWASSTGSLLAVGYVDGDILLWRIPSETHLRNQDTRQLSNNIVKLELSSGERRLPVIVLQFSTDGTSNNDHGGRLFVYGGDEIGSEEVLTVLNLDWSAGIDKVKCISRMDIPLCGSFAHMILVPKLGGMENTPAAAMFLLTNPGQLRVYDIASFSDSTSQKTKSEVILNKFPLTIPTADPSITVTKFCTLCNSGDRNKVLSKNGYDKRIKETYSFFENVKWPLTGGVPSGLWLDKDIGVDRLYMAGYQDGAVRIWDATHPNFSLLYVIFGKINGVELKNEISPVSALEFSTTTLCLAVGNDCGLVFLYDLCMSNISEKLDVHFVGGTRGEVHTIHQENEDFHCTAVFSISNSAVKAMHFSESGAKLAVGFKSGQVTVLDSKSMTVLFHVDNVPALESPIVSLKMGVMHNVNAAIDGSSASSQGSGDSADVLFILTRNSHVIVTDGVGGKILYPNAIHPPKDSTAISIYVADGSHFSFGVASENHPLEGNRTSPVTCDLSKEASLHPVLLICCEDAIQLFQLKSVIQGLSFHTKELILPKPCCWTSLIKRKDEKEAFALLLLYQNGVFEIRSFPNLEVLEEDSLSSILRWSFKANMAKTASSCDQGQIALLNGSELAVISILAGTNDFRIPESYPGLHDKVLAAAANAAANQSLFQKRRAGSAPGILGGLLEGLKRGKAAEERVTSSEAGPSPQSSLTQRLENSFSKAPFSTSPSASLSDEQLELSIDDIIIDEDLPTASTPSLVHQTDWKEKTEDREREQLFQGAKTDVKPRLRTPEEILAQYKFGGDAAAAAAHAKDKLAQRQEKLQRTKERTEELQNEAENFASMAHELARRMEGKKKWWKL